MMRFTFRPGIAFREGPSRLWTAIKRTVVGKLVFEDTDGQQDCLSPEEVQRLWQERRWIVDEASLGKAAKAFINVAPRDLGAVPERRREVVKRRLRYILAVERAFNRTGGSFVSTVEPLRLHIAEAAARLGDGNPPSPASLWRWFQRFSPTRCVMELLDGRERCAPISEVRWRGVFEESINEVFLNIQRYPSHKVFDRMTTKIHRINQSLGPDEQIPFISRATVYRWINKLYYEIVAQARKGKRVTERELRNASDRVRVDYILERVEIDHTPIDLQVIDKVTRLRLGRPWLTLAIDRKSRCILGFYVSFNPPSAYSVLACLRRAILPKHDLLKRFPDIRSEWPCHGVFDMLVVDNGMDLHANSIEAAALEMAVEVVFCGVAHPEMKGAIERMFRTIAEDLIHQLPGTTFSNVKKRGAYASEEKAAIDIETLTHLLVKWIVDYYHNKPHRGLAGKTPLEVWREGCAERVIELPAFPADLDVIAAHTAHCSVFHYGVQVDNLFYNSDLLREIRGRRDEKVEVEVRYREEDVGSIMVRDPRSNEFFEVPCVDREYSAGLNRAVHRLIVAQARKRFGDEWKRFHLLEIRAEIEAIIEKALSEKRVVDRKRAAQYLMQDSEAVIRALPSNEEEPMEGSEMSSAVEACLDFVESREVEAYPAIDLNMTEEEVAA